MASRDGAKTVFITGCSSGIGRSCVLVFAKAGYNVFATARKLETIQDLESLNEKLPGKVQIATCDVTSDESIVSALKAADTAFGTIDILVNNAGFGLFGPVEMLSIDDARYQFEVNVLGAMRLTQLVIPGMRTNGWGRIINVSSLAGRICVPMGSWYSASKHAMEALADGLRIELRSFGIEAISIMPGPVETEFISNVRTPIRNREDVPAVYKRIGEKLRERNDGNRHGSVSAEQVAEVIFKAASAAKPKTRYTITAQDKTSLLMRTILSDRMWDKLVISFYELGDALKQNKESSTV